MRGVVDTVSDEHHLHAARFQLTHGGDLVLREQSSADVIDANFGGNAGCGAGVVPGEQRRAGSGHGGDLSDRPCGSVTESVGESQCGGGTVVDTHDHCGVCGLFEFGDDATGGLVLLAQQCGTADVDDIVTDTGTYAAPRYGLEISRSNDL